MTRKLLTILFPLLILVFIPSTNAQNSTTPSAQAKDDTATKLKQQLQLVQEQKKAEVMRTVDEAKAKIQLRKEEFKTRIQTIKDQKKRTLVERIDVKLAEVNKNHTAKFSAALVKIQAFLDKIKQATTDPKVLADVSAAQTAIDTAKAAVEAQMVKVYTMEITDDATLRINAGTVVSQLRLDLVTVHKLVVNAKQAVQKLNTDRELIKKEAANSAR